MPYTAALAFLGKRVKTLRSQRGYSQEEFAELCGLHRTAIGLLETGKSIPRLDTLMIVSAQLGVTVAKLLQGIDPFCKAPTKKSRN